MLSPETRERRCEDGVRHIQAREGGLAYPLGLGCVNFKEEYSCMKTHEIL